MSKSIQRGLRDRERFQIKFKPGRDYSRNKFVRKVYSDESIMARMTLYKELNGHDGCVNTLYWSHGGDKLLSGSDDTMLCVWLPWENYRMAYAIETGHTQNIFSAKFMPKSSDSVIVTAAADSEIRVFDVNGYNDEHRLRHVYTCHRDRAKRIALENNPHEFLSCSEDGTVRHFDLRQPHVCSNTPFGRSRRRQQQQQQQQTGGRGMHEGCPAPLLDYGKYGIDLNTISINKAQPQYFVVAGMDDFVYMHDRRMVGDGGGRGAAGSPTTSAAAGSRCVRRFTCKDSNHWKHNNKHVTACKFSKANSQEFIGSWSTDGIFLFNIHDSPVENNARERNNNVKQTSRIKRNGRFSEEEHQQPLDEIRQSIIHCFRADRLNDTLDKLHLLHHSSQVGREPPPPGPSRATPDDESDVGETIWILCMKAAVHLRRVHQSNTHEQPSDASHAEEEIASARRLMQDAEAWCRTLLDSWRILWCLAVGYWIASGGQRTNGCEDREDWLRKAYRCAVRAQQTYNANRLDGSGGGGGGEAAGAGSSSSTPAAAAAAAAGSRSRDYGAMFVRFKHDIRQALSRENCTLGRSEGEQSNNDNENDRATPEEEETPAETSRWNWLDDMYLFDEEHGNINEPKQVNEQQQPTSKRPRRASSSTDNGSDEGMGHDDNTREHSVDQSITSRHATVGSSSDDQRQFSGAESMALSTDHGNNDNSAAEGGGSSPFSSASSSASSSNSTHVIQVEITEEYVGSDSDVSTSDHGASNSDVTHHSRFSDETATEDDDDDGEDDDDTQSMMDTDESEDEEEEEEHHMQERPRPRTHMRVEIDEEDTSDDDDDDDDDYPSRFVSRTQLENDVDIVPYRKRYFGHCNNRTVKGVNFYGASDEYVVSGSDDGCAFIWEKSSGRIVQILSADSDTVNVIEGHPMNPTMAISGIDNTVKIFNPVSRPMTTSRRQKPNEPTSWSTSSRMYELDRILARNEEDNRSASDDTYITQSMITALTRSMQNGRELGRLRELMNDNWGGDIDCRVQ